jgi:hypothetical protein
MISTFRDRFRHARGDTFSSSPVGRQADTSAQPGRIPALRKLTILVLATMTAGTAAAVTVSIGTQFNGGSTVNQGSADGTFDLSTSIGGYNSVKASGVADPFFVYPNFSTSSLDVSSTGTTDSLNVFVSESGLTSAPRTYGLNLLSSLGVTRVPSGWTLDTYVWLDPTNTVFGRDTLLVSRAFAGPLGASSVDLASFLDVTDPYSITVEYRIQSNGNRGGINATADINDVPTPSTSLLLGMGLTGLGFVMSRRRKVDSTDANNDLTVPSSADAWSAQGTLGFAARPLIANA